jgi:ribosomal protein S18 acetylase RimI-like enzyme
VPLRAAGADRALTAAIELRPLAQADYERWRAETVASYAAERVAAGNWTQAESLAKAEESFAKLLPDGPATPGQHLFSLWLVAEQRHVGVVWFHVRANQVAFIYDLVIDEAYRGKGLGKPAMAAMEAEMRRLGATSSALHVFGHNTAARRLYESCGYAITNIDMSKRLT